MSSGLLSNTAQLNINGYWNSDYYKDKSVFMRTDNYIIEAPNSIVHLIGDLEGDFVMILNWFLNNKFIDEDLEWIADSNVYVIQTGDQIDKYNAPRRNKITKKVLSHSMRRERANSVNKFESDFDVVILFDYLAFKSFEKHGSERVFSVMGNHEILSLQKSFRYSVDHAQNTSNFLSDYHLWEKITTSPYSPIYLIFEKRPVIIKFNNLIISHAGLNMTSISNYLSLTGRKDFDLDKFVNYVNGKGTVVYSKDNELYQMLIEPLVWNRDYHEEQGNPKLPIQNVNVIGHNSFKNVVVCDDQRCEYLDEINNVNVSKINMIKVDTGVSSRFCKNNSSDIYTAKIIFIYNELKFLLPAYYKFDCSIKSYPNVNFFPNTFLTRIMSNEKNQI